jgi:multicomponent Na+:H+ antiporter subunit B
MTVVVRVAVRTVLPFLVVAGAYLFLQGYSPGGGFPAGVVAAGLVLLTYTGFGYRRVARLVRPGPLEVLELLGAALVIVVLSLGLVLDGSFGANSCRWCFRSVEPCLPRCSAGFPPAPR